MGGDLIYDLLLWRSAMYAHHPLTSVDGASKFLLVKSMFLKLVDVPEARTRRGFGSAIQV